MDHGQGVVGIEREWEGRLGWRRERMDGWDGWDGWEEEPMRNLPHSGTVREALCIMSLGRGEDRGTSEGEEKKNYRDRAGKRRRREGEDRELHELNDTKTGKLWGQTRNTIKLYRVWSFDRPDPDWSCSSICRFLEVSKKRGSSWQDGYVHKKGASRGDQRERENGVEQEGERERERTVTKLDE